MTAEAPQPIDLIELARNNRLESKRVPQILRLSTEIVARLNRIFEEKQGRELITQEPVHEAAQFSVAGEEPIEVIIYTMKDTKWDRSIPGATCFGISVEDTGQRLEIVTDKERRLLEVRFVNDAREGQQQLKRFPALAEVEAYASLLDQVEGHLNRKKPASTALA